MARLLEPTIHHRRRHLAEMPTWTTHKATDGRLFYYNRETATSTWTKPDGYKVGMARHIRPTLSSCLDESPAVASLFNAILKHCGASALPIVRSREANGDPLCEGGRGGAFCCASQRIYICNHPWVGCREVAYELSHALNVCRGLVHCSRKGMSIDGLDCGFLGPPDVACSELRASRWTARCAATASKQEGDAENTAVDTTSDRSEDPARLRCMEWHARWAVRACYPEDAHVEAHVRWARYRCKPQGEDELLGRDHAADSFVDQAFRWA